MQVAWLPTLKEIVHDAEAFDPASGASGLPVLLPQCRRALAVDELLAAFTTCCAASDALKWRAARVSRAAATAVHRRKC